LKLHQKLYLDFIEAIDGIDNGVTQYVSSEPARYRSRTDLSSRVGGLNPRWNEAWNDTELDVRLFSFLLDFPCRSGVVLCV
jgi:urease accessory protein